MRTDAALVAAVALSALAAAATITLLTGSHDPYLIGFTAAAAANVALCGAVGTGAPGLAFVVGAWALVSVPAFADPWWTLLAIPVASICWSLHAAARWFAEVEETGNCPFCLLSRVFVAAFVVHTLLLALPGPVLACALWAGAAVHAPVLLDLTTRDLRRLRLADE